MAFPSEAEGIVWCSIFTLASALIVIGNLLTIILFTVNKRLRKKSLILVINMAVSDLMLGAISLPLYIYLVGVSDYQLWTETLDLNVPFLIADILATKASLISATFISCERFYAIYWPFKHRTLTTQTYYIVIFIVWTLALLNTCIFQMSSLRKLFPYILLSLGSTSAIIICGCNIAIWRKFQLQGIVAGSQHQNRDLQNERLTKILLFVSVLALLCWLPYIIVTSSILLLDFNFMISWRCLVIIDFVNYANAFVNPAVYTLRIPQFRQALSRCCLVKRVVVNSENSATGQGDEASSRAPVSLITLQIESGRDLQPLKNEEIMETKVWSTKN